MAAPSAKIASMSGLLGTPILESPYDPGPGQFIVHHRTVVVSTVRRERDLCMGRVVVHPPRRGAWPVQLEEAPQPGGVTTPDHVVRDLVAACPDALGHASDAKLRARHAHVHMPKEVPPSMRVVRHGAKTRLARVISNAKSTRCRASSRRRWSMIRPGWMVAPSELKPESPRAITSALTNSSTPSRPRRRAGAAVDFPAPFGPARTMTLGMPGF